MSAPKAIEFGGTDEELEKYVLEFARAAGGWAGRDRKTGARVVGLGSLLALNPNALPCRIRVAREDGGKVGLSPQAVAFPWTRRKAARVAAYRVGQLADFLGARARGTPAEKFDPGRLSEPFATFGRDPAAVTASIGWTVLCGLAAMAAAFVGATLASLPLMSLAIDEIAARSRTIGKAGGIALPSLAEIASLGWGFRLGCAMVFAFPLAFLAGVAHAAAAAAGDLGGRAARLPTASLLGLSAIGAAAFFPFTPLWALPAGLLIPLSAHVGYTFLWGLRRERVREGGRARPALAWAGVAAAAALAWGIAPAAEGSQRDFTDRLALFRDRYLLGHPLGKSLARAYYACTLYTADPMKRFYAKDPKVPQRAQRTARARDEAAAVLRRFRFTIVEDPPYDVEAESDRLRGEGGVVPCRWEPGAVSDALDRLSAESFRGGNLQSYAWLAWRSVFYAGPPVAVLAFVGLCCPFVSVMFRAMSRKAATIALLACLASTVLLMVLGDAAAADALETIRSLRTAPPDRIADALRHRDVAVRHEAAYRAFVLEDGHARLADALLPAAGDADFRVRLWACAALGKTGDPRALRVLVDRLKDREFFVRYRAAEGLGFLRNREAEEPLLRLTREGTWYEGLSAHQALHRLDPEKY
jgi:hypothetical protein